jgi:hypothetical protein
MENKGSCIGELLRQTTRKHPTLGSPHVSRAWVSKWSPFGGSAKAGSQFVTVRNTHTYVQYKVVHASPSYSNVTTAWVMAPRIWTSEHSSTAKPCSGTVHCY